MLELIAISKYGEKINDSCALSLEHQQIEFCLKGTSHTIKYKQSRFGNYFILKGVRYYFKVYDTVANKWVIDSDYF